MSANIKAQIAFGQWVNNWAQKYPGTRPNETVIQPDILDIMAIFKILGFETTFSNVSNPKEETHLQNQSKRLKVVVSCCSSGLKCSMELKTSCRCPKNVTDPKLWEIDDKNAGLITYDVKKKEIDDILTVSPDTQFLIRSVTNHFLHLINKTDQNANSIQQNMQVSKTPSKHISFLNSSTSTINNNISQTMYHTPKTNYKLSKQNTFVNIYAYNPTINVTSPNTAKSPARYRSLDTLTGNLSIQDIPEPGILRKDVSNEKLMPLVSSSSPNITDIKSMTSNSCQNCEPMLSGYNKLLAAQTLVHEVLGIMENSQNSAKINSDIAKIKKSIQIQKKSIEIPNKIFDKLVTKVRCTGILVNDASEVLQNGYKKCKTTDLFPIKGSIDSLLEKQQKLSVSTPKLSSASKSTSLKPKCRAPIRSTGCLKSTISGRKSPTTKVTSSGSASATKSLENVASATNQRTPIAIKPNPKYKHIKSTITKTKSVTIKK